MDLERLYDQLDRVEDTLDSITPRLAAIETDLAYHIKRSDMLEAEHKALEKSHNRLQGFFMISGWVVGITATILTVLNFLKVI